jgi:hypothetical protein
LTVDRFRTPGLARRAFLRGALATVLLPLARPLGALAAPAALPDTTLRLLETSPFVYVSPLSKGGDESTCHGEVWYAWIDGAVVLITAKTSWKARSVAAGRDRARLWVGDHGRWKQLTGRNEGFRLAPQFDARVTRTHDAALVDRLLAAYEKKYPAEIETWRDRFRSGFASGERWLLRYEPIAG